MTPYSLTKLHIGNLPFGQDFNSELYKLFEDCGTVTEFTIKTRYGFVHYERPEDASKAINYLNGLKFHGSEISVQYSTTPNPAFLGQGRGAAAISRDRRAAPTFQSKNSFQQQSHNAHFAFNSVSGSYTHRAPRFTQNRSQRFQDPTDFLNEGNKSPRMVSQCVGGPSNFNVNSQAWQESRNIVQQRNLIQLTNGMNANVGLIGLHDNKSQQAATSCLGGPSSYNVCSQMWSENGDILQQHQLYQRNHSANANDFSHMNIAVDQNTFQQEASQFVAAVYREYDFYNL